jgi:hypothetical protein
MSQSQWWKCPHCQSKVDFTEQMNYVFDETGEAEFDAEHGLFFHTIFCDECDARWTTGISSVSPKTS